MADQFNEEKVDEDKIPNLVNVENVEEPKTTTDTQPKSGPTPGTEGENTEFGCPSKYIDLVLEQLQTKVSRELVAKTLKSNNFDIVNTVIQLEMVSN